MRTMNVVFPADTDHVLTHLVRHHKDPKVVQRAHAVRLIACGWSVKDVARECRRSVVWVRNWVHRYTQQGAEGLESPPKLGCPVYVVTPAFQGALQALLKESPRSYGLHDTTWSIRKLKAVLAQHKGLPASHETIRKALLKMKQAS